MEILTERQILEKIREGCIFSAQIDSGAFKLSIKEYVPAVITAIHDGHRVIEYFAAKMKVTEDERQFEEDPYTGTVADGFDISLKVLDSRYCYDLNRKPELCIYEDAWGKEVWKEALNNSDIGRLLACHGTYYRVLDELLTMLTDKFEDVILYDLHSYNYSRLEGNPPLFNIGTHFIDLSKYDRVIKHLTEELRKIELPGFENRAAIDEVFKGKGYQAEFINQNYSDVLCIPLEIKKAFMDEQGFALTLKKDSFKPLFSGMIEALSRNGEVFKKMIGNKKG